MRIPIYLWEIELDEIIRVLKPEISQETSGENAVFTREQADN